MDITSYNGKKIVIYGAGQIARLVVLVLKDVLEDYRDNLVGCAVSFANNNVKELEGIPIHEIDFYANRNEDFLYLIAVKEVFKPQIIEELNKREITNYEFFDCQAYIELLEKKWKEIGIKRYLEFKENIDREVLTDEEYLLFLSKQLKCGVLNFEINLVDHCNLNCQSCNHFSPIAEKVYVNCKQLEKDLDRLNELIGKNIGRVMLLGGEPLLHPEINKILEIVRKKLPDATLVIVTNGLLLPKMATEFWDCLRKYVISLEITKYPIDFDYAECDNIAKRYGVAISYGHLPEPVKTTYLMPIKDTPQFNPHNMYAKCAHANYCVVLREGRIYNCSFTANVHHYNKYFGKSLPEDKDVSIDIYDIADWNEVEEFLKKPNKMCSYCDICGYIYDIPWATSKKDVREWMGEN